jgi:hypothetical protein
MSHYDPFRRSRRRNIMSEIEGERTWRGRRNLVAIDPHQKSGRGVCCNAQRTMAL